MATLGEGYRALGAGMSSQYQRDRDEMKKLMKLQQRQQLMTAALTPLAQGVGQFATDLISAPFKDAADNFYRRGAGKGFNAKVKAFKAKRADALSRYAEIQKQGHRTYFSGLQEEAEALYDAEMLSAGRTKDSPLYNEGKARLFEQVREQQDLEYQQVRDEVDYFLQAATPEDIDKAIEKYSPYPTNLGQWTYRTAKRLVTGQSKEEVEEAALDKLRTHLNLNDDEIKRITELNRLGSDYYFSQEVLAANPIFNDERFLSRKEEFASRVDYQGEVLSSGNGGLQRIYRELAKDNYLPSREEIQDATAAQFYDVLNTDYKDDRTRFVRIKSTSEEQPVALEKFLRTVPQAQLESTKNDLYQSAFDTAQLLQQERYLSNESMMTSLRTAEGKNDYRKSIPLLANYLLENNIELVQTSLAGRDGKQRLAVVGDFEAYKRQIPTEERQQEEEVLFNQEISRQQFDFNSLSNSNQAAAFTQGIQSIIDRGLTSEDTTAQIDEYIVAQEADLAAQRSKELGTPVEIKFTLTPAQQQLIESSTEQSYLMGLVKTRPNPNYVPNEERIRQYELQKLVEDSEGRRSRTAEEGSSYDLVDRLNAFLKPPAAAGDRRVGNLLQSDRLVGQRDSSEEPTDYVSIINDLLAPPESSGEGRRVGNLLGSDKVSVGKKPSGSLGGKTVSEDNKVAVVALINDLLAAPVPTGKPRSVGNLLGSSRLMPSATPDGSAPSTIFTIESSGFKAADVVDFINSALAAPPAQGRRSVGNALGSSLLAPSSLPDGSAPSKDVPVAGIINVINNILDFQGPVKRTKMVGKDTTTISDKEMAKLDSEILDQQAADIAFVIKNVRGFKPTQNKLEELEKSLRLANYPADIVDLVLSKVKS